MLWLMEQLQTSSLGHRHSMKTLSQITFSSASHELMKAFIYLFFYLGFCFVLWLLLLFFCFVFLSKKNLKSYFALSKHSSIECVINAAASLERRWIFNIFSWLRKPIWKIERDDNLIVTCYCTRSIHKTFSN